MQLQRYARTGVRESQVVGVEPEARVAPGPLVGKGLVAIEPITCDWGVGRGEVHSQLMGAACRGKCPYQRQRPIDGLNFEAGVGHFAALSLIHI